MDFSTKHVFLSRCSFSSPARRRRNRVRFRHYGRKSHRYDVSKLIAWRQPDGSINAMSGLLLVSLCDEADIPTAMAHLVHRSTHLQDLRAMLNQLSRIHDELQRIHSRACHLRSKLLRIEELRTQDPEGAFIQAQKVAEDMMTNGGDLSDLVALEAALQQKLQHLREDAG